jgi:hypothetical protein
MSDDYHDDDSRSGGLWDPDAYAPRPGNDRPHLRVIASDDGDDRPYSDDLVADSGDALVRLDQFRPLELSDTSPARWSPRRCAAALSAAVLVLGAIAVAATQRLPRARDHAPATASRLAADPEQSALSRKVAPPHAPARQRPRSSHRAGTHAKSPAKRRSTTSVATQVRSTPDVGSSTQAQPQAVPASKPTKKLHQYDALSSDTSTAQLHQPVAASEFGFEN